MKKYLPFSLSLFIVITIFTKVKAQENIVPVTQGGYIYHELGGTGLPAFTTLGYEYIKPLNHYSFLSTKIGFNGLAGPSGYHFGSPHGLSINLGKELFFLEAGVNGWFGYFETDNYSPPATSGFNGLVYTVGTNLGVCMAFNAIDKIDIVARAYINSNFAFSDAINPQFFWIGLGWGIRFHK